jgi:hypothetical protein
LEIDMKRFAIIAVTALAVGCVGATQASATPINPSNLVVNGNFADNNLNGGWGLFSNGSVTGWTGSEGDIELDTAGPIGPGANHFSVNSLEVNANTPETVSQTITGLVVGQTYELVWEYGGRPGSGGTESMVVDLDGSGIQTDSSGIVSVLTWTGESYSFVATGTSVTLDFAGQTPGAGGNGSYGNEVTGVGLYATPEPSTWLLMLSGLGLLGFAMWRKRDVFAAQPVASI